MDTLKRLIDKGFFRDRVTAYRAKPVFHPVLRDLQGAQTIDQKRDFARPQWCGEPLGGKTILLQAEQGFGDTIQFCRYVSLVASNARVILQAPRSLARLLSTLKGVEEIVVQGDPLPTFDLHCPLLSVPRALGTILATIPGGVPYLAADPASVAV